MLVSIFGGVNINLTRRYGRAIGKERVYDYAPLNTPKSTTMPSCIRMDGTMIHQKLSGAVNREHFLDYVTNFLTPFIASRRYSNHEQFAYA